MSTLPKLKSSVVLIFTLSLFLLSSCDKKEGCTDPLAENFDPSAELENGSCINQREKFLGIYEGNVLCIQPPNGAFTSHVIPSNQNLDDVFIGNFGGRFTQPIRATVFKSTLTIPRQDPDAIGFYVTGTGNLVGNELTIQFETSYAGVTNNCVYTLLK
jgi:hypothetical protein